MPGQQPVPFRLLGESALRAVQQTLEQTVSGWASDWGVTYAQVDIGVRRAWDYAPGQRPAWRASAQAAGRQIWSDFGADFAKGLELAMFSSDPDVMYAGGAGPTLAPAAAQEALAALRDALIRAALPCQPDMLDDTAAAPIACWRHGSGALVARLSVGRRHGHILLDGSTVQALIDPAAALPALPAVDVAASIAAVPVSLRLGAGTARVGLGALLSLAPGDVIRLDLDAHAPLALGTVTGHPLFNAYLGRSGDCLAVELVHIQTQVGEAQ